MSTAYAKELAAGSLRWYADQVETALDSLPALSVEAWDCPAADAFIDGVAAQDAQLAGAADTMRVVAAALDNLAALQREAEAAEAAAAAAAAAEAAESVPAASGSATVGGGAAPPNVF